METRGYFDNSKLANVSNEQLKLISNLKPGTIPTDTKTKRGVAEALDQTERKNILASIFSKIVHSSLVPLQFRENIKDFYLGTRITKFQKSNPTIPQSVVQSIHFEEFAKALDIPEANKELFRQSTLFNGLEPNIEKILDQRQSSGVMQQLLNSLTKKYQDLNLTDDNAKRKIQILHKNIQKISHLMSEFEQKAKLSGGPQEPQQSPNSDENQLQNAKRLQCILGIDNIDSYLAGISDDIFSGKSELNLEDFQKRIRNNQTFLREYVSTFTSQEVESILQKYDSGEPMVIELCKGITKSFEELCRSKNMNNPAIYIQKHNLIQLVQFADKTNNIFDPLSFFGPNLNQPRVQAIVQGKANVFELLQPFVTLTPFSKEELALIEDQKKHYPVIQLALDELKLSYRRAFTRPDRSSKMISDIAVQQKSLVLLSKALVTQMQAQTSGELLSHSELESSQVVDAPSTPSKTKPERLQMEHRYRSDLDVHSDEQYNIKYADASTALNALNEKVAEIMAPKYFLSRDLSQSDTILPSFESFIGGTLASLVLGISKIDQDNIVSVNGEMKFVNQMHMLPNSNGYILQDELVTAFTHQLWNSSYCFQDLTKEQKDLIRTEIEEYKEKYIRLCDFLFDPKNEPLLRELPPGYINLQSSLNAMEERIQQLEDVFKHDTNIHTLEDLILHVNPQIKFTCALSSLLRLNPEVEITGQVSMGQKESEKFPVVKLKALKKEALTETPPKSVEYLIDQIIDIGLDPKEIYDMCNRRDTYDEIINQMYLRMQQMKAERSYQSQRLIQNPQKGGFVVTQKTQSQTEEEKLKEQREHEKLKEQGAKVITELKNKAEIDLKGRPNPKSTLFYSIQNSWGNRPNINFDSSTLEITYKGNPLDYTTKPGQIKFKGEFHKLSEFMQEIGEPT